MKLGIAGAVFFTLEGENGRLYTKNGNFTLDPSGFLTNPTGHYVLDTNGNRIPLQNDDFTVRADGVIIEGGNIGPTIAVSYAARPDALLKRDNGLFATEGGEDLVAAQGVAGVSYSMQQGFLERSNVDAARTMTDMLTAYRAFEANQKVLQAYDRSMEKAVTEIGRVN